MLGGAQISFFVAMPASWSRKKREELKGQPHTTTPDLDNLLKSFADTLFLDDCEIWRVAAQKLWSDKGCIVLAGLED